VITRLITNQLQGSQKLTRKMIGGRLIIVLALPIVITLRI